MIDAEKSSVSSDEQEEEAVSQSQYSSSSVAEP